NNKFLLLRPSLIHEGVSGIVAGKVKNKYGLPVAVLSASAEQDEPNDPDRVLKGSARSIDGVNMIEMLKNHEELFLKLGGHAMAAGFSIPAKHETVLRERLNAEMRERLIAEPNLLDEADLSDVSLNPDAVDLELAKLLEQFEPTGSGNPRPLIKFEKVKAEGFVPMGEGGRHLRFHVQNVPCVFFGYAEAVSERYARGKLQKNHIEEGDVLTFIGTLHVNRWNGKESLQFIVSSVSDESAGR
ncbi:MAG: hypothetical protein LBN36_03080, partial [Clostridiales Family XIII bacterium]|nr:hypothetical protein [Clostridiales Family XIII bacterium]